MVYVLEIDAVVKHAAGIFNRKPRKEMGTFVRDRHLQFERNPGRCFLTMGQMERGAVRLVTQGFDKEIPLPFPVFEPLSGKTWARTAEIAKLLHHWQRCEGNSFLQTDDLISISRFFPPLLFLKDTCSSESWPVTNCR